LNRKGGGREREEWTAFEDEEVKETIGKLKRDVV